MAIRRFRPELYLSSLAAYLHILCIPKAARYNKSCGFMGLNPVLAVYPYVGCPN
jgi:hypothetical protein